MRATILAIGGLLVAGCAPAIDAAADAAIETRELRGEISAEERGDLRASVRAASTPGGTAVTISVADARQGATHPWHIHHGRCGTGGDIVGDPAAYPPLRPGSGGSAEAQAVLPRRPLIRGQSYSVHIHASPQDLATIVGCMDLR